MAETLIGLMKVGRANTNPLARSISPKRSITLLTRLIELRLDFHPHLMILGDALHILLGDALEPADIAVVAKVAKLDAHGVAVATYTAHLIFLGFAGKIGQAPDTFDDALRESQQPQLCISGAGVLDEVVTKCHALKFFVIRLQHIHDFERMQDVRVATSVVLAVVSVGREHQHVRQMFTLLQGSSHTFAFGR